MKKQDKHDLRRTTGVSARTCTVRYLFEDLLGVKESDARLFADDTEIFRIILYRHSETRR